LPLGGYVKITGMSREELFDREYDAEGRLISETPVAPEIAARAYCNSTTPRKVATILAGPMANVLVAIVLFAVSFWVGIPQFDRTNEVASVAIGKPADVANLQAGDRILSINGVKPAKDNIDAMVTQIESNVGRTITVVVQRDGTQRSVKVGPIVPDAQDKTIGRLGVTFQQDVVATDRYSFFGGLGKMFTDKTTREQLSGAVGIGAAYNDNVQYGIGQVLLFSGLISLILAIMNLIPLLPLDGGHIVFALAERVRGRNLSMAVYQRASVIGIALVLLLAFYGFSNDISHLTGSGTRP
jgi:regulator of sigma E protease